MNQLETQITMRSNGLNGMRIIVKLSTNWCWKWKRSLIMLNLLIQEHYHHCEDKREEKEKFSSRKLNSNAFRFSSFPCLFSVKDEKEEEEDDDGDDDEEEKISFTNLTKKIPSQLGRINQFFLFLLLYSSLILILFFQFLNLISSLHPFLSLLPLPCIINPPAPCLSLRHVIPSQSTNTKSFCCHIDIFIYLKYIYRSLLFLWCLCLSVCLNLSSHFSSL